MDAAILQPGYCVLDFFLVSDNIQTTFGGKFAPLFGHKACVVGGEFDGKFDHLRRRCHLEIDLGRRALPQSAHIALLKMPPVLSQMKCDSIRTGLFGHQRSGDGIGNIDAAGLTHRRDMINVDAEANHVFNQAAWCLGVGKIFPQRRKDAEFGTGRDQPRKPRTTQKYKKNMDSNFMCFVPFVVSYRSPAFAYFAFSAVNSRSESLYFVTLVP